VIGRRVFVDTNVLVYASQAASQFFDQATAALARLEDAGDELCVSRQVFREYLAAVTRPQADMAAVPAAMAVASIRRLLEIYPVLEEGPAVTEQLLELVEHIPTGGRQVHDANLVAIMLVHGIKRLLTFNAGDFRRFGGVIELVAP